MRQIGDIAHKTKTSVHTLRYYEKLGLIGKPQRSQGGFRMYPDQTSQKVSFIKKAQSFGLSLKDIKKIMVCGERGLEPCCEMTADIFSRKISEFEDKIKELQSIKRKLAQHLSGWAKSKRDKCKTC